MNGSANLDESLRVVATILLWCFGLGMALLLVWFGLLVFLGDFVYDVHARFFQIPRQQFDTLHYLAMMLTKIGLFNLFLFPYVGIRVALRKRSR
jgi:hypothetical protein